MTDYDTWPAFRHLATCVAAELGRLRGETWTVAAWHDNSAHPAGTLAPLAGHGPEHAQVGIQHGYDAAGKVTVKGVWPDGSTYKAPSRNVDPARGARAIAQAISTYILGPGTWGYLAGLPEKAAAKQRADQNQAYRAEVMARFAALVEADPPGAARLSLSPYLPMRGEVSLNHHPEDGEDAPRVSLELHGLPVETALAMVEVLAASPDARGRCCRQYGPGHDQRLSRLGCLRAAARDAEPTWQEGDALYSLYRAADTSEPWADWLGDTEVQAAWR